MKAEINVLETLAKMEEFRQNHQNEKQDPADWCMRFMEAIVAKSAGYESRNDWTAALKTMQQPEDDRDARIAALEAEVQRLRCFIRKQAEAAGRIEHDLETCLAEALNQKHTHNEGGENHEHELLPLPKHPNRLG